jgi:CHASE2 domain-containing sensor protein
LTIVMRAFLRRLLSAAPWLFVFTALTGWLEIAGILTPLSNFGRDAFGIFRGYTLPTQVRIVEVDQHAYDHLFGGKLNSAALTQLLDALEAAAPRLIAVDLFTSSPDFAGFRLKPSWTHPIVWAEDMVPDDPGCRTVPECSYHSLALFGEHVPVERDGCTNRGLCAGLPVFLPDESNGTIRTYSRTVEIRGLTSKPTFPWAAVVLCASTVPRQPACDAAVRRADDEENLQTIAFDAPYPWHYRLPAEQAMDNARKPGWPHDSELRDSIVLIGPTYLTNDFFRVPTGYRPGVWLNAQVIENELGRRIVELPFWAGLALDLLIGVVLVYLLWRLPGLGGVGASAGLVVVVLVLSYLAFGRIGVWLNFVPIIVSVGLHDAFEHFTGHRRLGHADAELS